MGPPVTRRMAKRARDLRLAVALALNACVFFLRRDVAWQKLDLGEGQLTDGLTADRLGTAEHPQVPMPTTPSTRAHRDH
jgi:hypothetical protein